MKFDKAAASLGIIILGEFLFYLDRESKGVGELVLIGLLIIWVFGSRKGGD